jgi:hypothetical protein
MKTLIPARSFSPRYRFFPAEACGCCLPFGNTALPEGKPGRTTYRAHHIDGMWRWEGQSHLSPITISGIRRKRDLSESHLDHPDRIMAVR